MQGRQAGGRRANQSALQGARLAVAAPASPAVVEKGEKPRRASRAAPSFPLACAFAATPPRKYTTTQTLRPNYLPPTTPDGRPLSDTVGPLSDCLTAANRRPPSADVLRVRLHDGRGQPARRGRAWQAHRRGRKGARALGVTARRRAPPRPCPSCAEGRRRGHLLARARPHVRLRHFSPLHPARAQVGFDDNAAFRQPDIFKQRDWTQEDPKEVQAAEFDLNYIALDGTRPHSAAPCPARARLRPSAMLRAGRAASLPPSPADETRSGKC